MPRPGSIMLDYVSPAAFQARRRSKRRRILFCYIIPLPVVLLVGLVSGWFEAVPPPVPPGTQFASADIRRGNAAGDFNISAYGFVKGGRPVFDQVSVTFSKPSGRMLIVHLSDLTYQPFANSMNSANDRPITPSAMLAHYASIGCNPADPRTMEMADALDADLHSLANGTAPHGKLWTGPYYPPPVDYLVTPLAAGIAWLVLSSAAAAVVSL